MKLRETSSGRQCEIELEQNGSTIEARVDGATFKLERQPLPDSSMLVEIGAARVRAFAARAGESIVVSVGPHTFSFTPVKAARAGARHSLATPLLTAPMPGKVLRILVAEGDQVEAGQPLITVEAMKMETTLNAEGAARVKRIPVLEGQMIDAGTVLIELSPLDSSKP